MEALSLKRHLKKHSNHQINERSGKEHLKQHHENHHHQLDHPPPPYHALHQHHHHHVHFNETIDIGDSSVKGELDRNSAGSNRFQFSLPEVLLESPSIKSVNTNFDSLRSESASDSIRSASVSSSIESRSSLRNSNNGLDDCHHSH